MGNPILESIKELRKERALFVDLKNKNRYKVVAEEEDGSKTAYCFAVPVYDRSGRLLDLEFHRNATGYRAEGSNSTVCVSDEFLLENSEGTCRIIPREAFRIRFAGKYVLHGNDCDVSPTTNGLVFKVRCENGACRFGLTVDGDSWEARGNNKCFSLMRETNCPGVTVSCIGSADENGWIVAPAILESNQEEPGTFVLSIIPQSPYAKFVVFEINLYEQKLFQDTTVESQNADSNNVYGGTAFLGETTAFGEQWLYSRPDVSKLADLAGRGISKAVLHMNQFNKGADLCAFRVERRFCSFGSTWNNKIGVGSKFTESRMGGIRQSLDLTDLVVNRRTGRLSQPDGFLVKAKTKGSGFSVVSTGDSFYAPQILELQYK